MQRSTRRKSLTRHGYWLDPAVNPWHPAHTDESLTPEVLENLAHQALTEEYAARLAAGDAEAIFEYARLDAWCFRVSWVVEQVERWRDEGEDQKLRSLMAAFTRNAQKGSPEDLVATIRNDQDIFRRTTQRPAELTLEQWFGDMADELGCSADQIWAVYKAYRAYWEQQRTLGLSADEFFARLATMADRIGR